MDVREPGRRLHRRDAPGSGARAGANAAGQRGSRRCRAREIPRHRASRAGRDGGSTSPTTWLSSAASRSRCFGLGVARESHEILPYALAPHRSHPSVRLARVRSRGAARHARGVRCLSDRARTLGKDGGLGHRGARARSRAQAGVSVIVTRGCGGSRAPTTAYSPADDGSGHGRRNPSTERSWRGRDDRRRAEGLRRDPGSRRRARCPPRGPRALRLPRPAR